MSQSKRTRTPSNESVEKKQKLSGATCDDGSNNSKILPEDYFSLALVLLDGSNLSLFQDKKNGHVAQLFEHAEILSNDKNALHETIESILSILETNDQQLKSLQHKTFFNKERDHSFIVSTLQHLQDKTSKSYKLFQLHKAQDHFLQHVLFDNIKFARLLPLIHLIFNYPLEIMSSPELSQIQEQTFYTVDEEISKGDFSSSSILDITQRHDIHSSFSEDFISMIPNTDMFMSNEVNSNDEEQDFSILSANNDIILLDNPDSSQSEAEEFSITQQESIPTMPNYHDLTLAELKASLKKYGYKGSNSRQQMIQKLEGIWMSLNTKSNQENIRPEEEKEETPSDSVKANIIHHIKTYKPDTWRKIVNYENIDLNECFEGMGCKKSELKAFLDEYVERMPENTKASPKQKIMNISKIISTLFYTER
ncbi:hypothetical protein G6F43_002524 [Rhizopus delemar]|nr:hypothetical protein G6F43_002524 [Rhizopus delemar]